MRSEIALRGLVFIVAAYDSRIWLPRQAGRVMEMRIDLLGAPFKPKAPVPHGLFGLAHIT